MPSRSPDPFGRDFQFPSCPYDGTETLYLRFSVGRLPDPAIPYNPANIPNRMRGVSVTP